MSLNIVDKYDDREYSALATDKGVVLCDKQDGAFLVLRSLEDLENLKTLLNKIQIYKMMGE
jgi:hypothetical protein